MLPTIKSARDHCVHMIFPCSAVSQHDRCCILNKQAIVEPNFKTGIALHHMPIRFTRTTETQKRDVGTLRISIDDKPDLIPFPHLILDK